MKEKTSAWVTTIVFIAIIFGFSILNILKPDRFFSESENRYLQKKPKFSFNTLLNGKYTKTVEKYITDQFIKRDELIGLKTQMEYLIGKKDSNGVYFAKDGYLIEKHNRYDLDKEQLNKNIDRLAEFINISYKKLGKNHVTAMIVPTATEILKTKLPYAATNFDQQEVLNQIKSKIPNDTYVDLIKTLSQHSNEYIYYKTDHHWTSKGAYYGYQAYCNKIGQEGLKSDQFNINIATIDFYGTIYSKARLSATKPDMINSYIPKGNPVFTVDYNMGAKKTSSLYEPEFLNQRDKYSYFLGGNNALVKIESHKKNGKHLLLIKDSYAHSFVPFIANDYETISMIDLRYFNMSLKEYIAQNNFTDMMVMYNLVSFTKDKDMIKLNK